MPPPAPDLKAIFAAALDHPSGSERSAYLERVCGVDGSLRLQLEALLRAHDKAGHFLDSAADPDQATVFADFALAPPATADATLIQASEPSPTADAPRPLSEGPGMIIGPYKLLQIIGEGGMGTVFMAEQEKPIRRKVALKVIKQGMDTRQVVARFEAERQALAMMDHPHIARVLDAGATATGRPFFVMELVRGVPITEYCDKNQLTPRERLELFIPVCQAIQHAHQKGIIHRDIKPSNVLVTLYEGRPEAKVIDFGVAKAIEQRLTERTMFTEFGAIIGTLEYMSPEQAEMGALDIDTRSDIYSLGVLLYELLTGSTPLDRARLRQAAYSEILRRIREEEPSKPSTKLSESQDALPSISAQRKTEPARLPRLMRGDLDWIVMKSLDKDRTRRYETANGFARDIQRYLDGDAVEASPPSARYRLAKFARKHRGALATVGAFAVLLLLATVTSAGLAYWANTERLRATRAEKATEAQLTRVLKAEAEAQAQRVRAEESAALAKHQQARAQEREGMAIDAVKRFGDVVSENSELKNNPKLDALRKTLLKEPQDFFRKLRDQLQGDRDTTPESLARLGSACYDLGVLTNDIGSKEDALAAFEQSRIVRERLARLDMANPQLQADLARSHFGIGMVQRESGRKAEALASFGRVCDLWERLTRDHPSTPYYLNQLCWGRAQIASIEADFGHVAEALVLYEQIYTDRDQQVRTAPANSALQASLAQSLLDVGLMQIRLGQVDKALMKYEQAVLICRRLARDYPLNARFQQRLAISYGCIGAAQRGIGQFTEALASLERAHAINDRLTLDNPSSTDHQHYLASNLGDVAFTLGSLGRPIEALAVIKRSCSIHERLVRDNPSSTVFLESLAGDYRTASTLLRDQDRLPEALAAHEQAQATYERLACNTPTNTVYQVKLVRCYDEFAITLKAMGRSADALAPLERVRAFYERRAGTAQRDSSTQLALARIHDQIGKIQYGMNQTAAAEASFERVRAIHEQLARDFPTDREVQIALATSCCELANSFGRVMNRAAEGLACYQQSGAIFARLVGADPANKFYRYQLSWSLANIGVFQGATTEAVATERQAVALQQQLAAEQPANRQYQLALAWMIDDLGATLRRTGQVDEALVVHRRAGAIWKQLIAASPGDAQLQDKYAANRDHLADAHRKANRAERAKALIDEARAIRATLAATNRANREQQARLTAVIAGQNPKDNAERLELADLAYRQNQPIVAVKLFAEALRDEPKLGEDRLNQSVYHAACAAALAGCRRVWDAAPLDEVTRMRYRQQAREWLRSELTSLTKVAAAGTAEAKEQVKTALVRWKVDADLAWIRNEPSLAELPEAEQAEFRKLWDEVHSLWARVKDGSAASATTTLTSKP